MKINVKTLEGTHFVIQVNPQDTVADVKKNIEAAQGGDLYPASQQVLIHLGKVLEDATTLEENQVVEDHFVEIMLSKEIPEEADVPEVQAPQPALPTSGPNNTNPQDIREMGYARHSDFLRNYEGDNSEAAQAIRDIMQLSPDVMEVFKALLQDPEHLRMFEELPNEPPEDENDA